MLQKFEQERTKEKANHRGSSFRNAVRKVAKQRRIAAARSSAIG
jgi:hypothetical protein